MYCARGRDGRIGRRAGWRRALARQTQWHAAAPPVPHTQPLAWRGRCSAAHATFCDQMYPWAPTNGASHRRQP